MRLAKAGLLVVVAMLVAMFASRADAAESLTRDIDTGWQFRLAEKAEAAPSDADLQQWHPAQVPGVVQTDLLTNHLIPEPFARDNETRLQWIGESGWEYQTTFAMDSAALAREHIDLVFDGLDTFANVYLNDHLLAQTDNEFRRWRIPVKQLLQTGPNTLRVVFHSPIAKMLPYVKSLPYVLPAISSQNGGNEENIATAPYTRKAPYNYGWDWGPRFITEGIWRPVRLESWTRCALRIFTFNRRA